MSVKRFSKTDGRRAGANSTSGTERSPAWLVNSEEAAKRLSKVDWSRTSLGALADWPGALRTTLNLVLNSGLPTLIAWGPDMLIFHNDAYAPLLAGKEGALGRSFPEVSPEIWERVGPAIRRAFAGRRSHVHDLATAIRRDGVLQEACWTFSCSPVVEEDGDVCGVACVALETTERKRIEERLRRSEASLRALSDAAPSLLWRASSEGTLQWTNKRFKNLFGLGPAPTQMPDWNRWVHPEEQHSLGREWEVAQAEGRPFSHEHRLLQPDGRYRWFMARSEPVLGPTGEIAEWIGTAIDIHDLRSAMAARAESEALFREFAQNSTNLLWVADIETQAMLFISPAYEAIWGEDGREQATWDHWLDTVHPEDRARMEGAFERLVAGEVLQEEYRIVRPDHSVRWVRETMFPIVSEDGAIRRAGGIAQDVTRQNRMVVHLVDGDAETRNHRSQRLQALGYEVRPFASAEPFLKVTRALLPGCVLFQSQDAGPDLERVASALGAMRDRLPLVLVTDVADARRAIDLMKAGVKDIVPYASADGDLERVVATALASVHEPAPPTTTGGEAARRSIAALPTRERQVLEKIVAGATNKLIARELDISPRTVETYRFRLMERLGVSTFADVVRLAVDAGFGKGKD